MKKGFLFTLALSLILIPAQFSYAANPKSGARCFKINQKQIYSGKTYTCIVIGKKLVWDKGFVVKAETNQTVQQSKYIYTPADNPVVAKINFDIKTLRQPVVVSDLININIEKNIPEDAIRSIQLQHKYMVEAFPEVFKWAKNTYFIFQSTEWAKKMAIDSNCWIPPQLIHPEEIPPTMWSISTNCGVEPRDGSISAAFLNWPSFEKYDHVSSRNVDGQDMWEYQAGQEIDGGSIQAYYDKGRPIYGLGNPLPAWYEQGGQFALSSIALAVQIRTWRQSSLMQGQVYTCGGRLIENSVFYNANPLLGGCHYALGAIATELMVALYGFDAPYRWYQKNVTPNQASETEKLEIWQRSFKEAFGEDISDFYKMANNYSRYLDSNGKTKLSDEILARLKI